MRLNPEHDATPPAARPTPAGRRTRTAAHGRRAATRLIPEVLEGRCLLTFLPAVNAAVGYAQAAVAVGDFNGDGKPDLATCTFNTVTVLVGSGNGTFQSPLNSAAGSNPGSMAVGDFNGDGKLDIVTANRHDLSVLLGNGNGTFQPPQEITIGSDPASVVVGDLNGDGKLDIAVLSNRYYQPSYYGYGGGFVGFANVLMGHGDGTFSAPTVTTLSAGQHIDAVLADLNGDHKLDFVATDLYGSVDVLYNNGAGVLQGLTNFAAGGGAWSVAAGDVNGDGKTDLVTTSYYYYGNTTVNVLPGDGQGGFGGPVSYATGGTVGQFAEGVVLGDFNKDGRLDIATTIAPNNAYYTSNQMSVLEGRGDGTFSAPLIATIGSDPYGLATGDFNGDGWPDVATADSQGTGLSILLNDRSWPTIAAPAFSVSGLPVQVTAGTAGSLTVQAENSDGSINTGYTGTVQFTSSDPHAVLPGPYTFTAADAGVHTFSAILETAGTQSITVTDNATPSLGGAETGIAVTPAAASAFLVSGFPSPIAAGVGGQLTVTAMDAYGNVATNYAGTVHFSSSDPQAALPGDTTLANGTGDFGAVLYTVGSQSLTASDSANPTLTGTQGGIVVNPAVTTLIVSGFPSPTTAGVPGTFTITAEDASGHVATWYTGTVSLSCTDSQAAIPAYYTFSAADAGVHTFTATLRTAGTQSITASDTTAAGLAGTEVGITVKAATASRFLLIAPSSVRAGVPFSLTIKVEDAYGNIVTGYTGTVHFSSTDSTATVPANYTFTASDSGLHTFIGLVLRKRTKRTTITVTDTKNSALTASLNEVVM